MNDKDYLSMPIQNNRFSVNSGLHSNQTSDLKINNYSSLTIDD